jgi:hypothetical protein
VDIEDYFDYSKLAQPLLGDNECLQLFAAAKIEQVYLLV